VKPGALSAALLMSRDLAARPWRGTGWAGGTYDVSAPFSFEYPSSAALVGDLTEYALKPDVYDARSGLVLSYATHKHPEAGGRKDSDCGEITALVLDADKPPLPADPEIVSAALRSVNVAHFVARKPSGKCHAVIALTPIVAAVDLPGWKDDRRKRFRHAIEVFSAFANREFDPAMADGCMRAVNGYHRRAKDDPPVQLVGYEGGTLDLYRFATLTGFSAEAVGTVPTLAAASDVVAPPDRRSRATILEHLRAKLARYRKQPDLREAVGQVLQGLSFASPGGRDSMLLKVCNLIAIMEPFADPEMLAEALRPSLNAMLMATPNDPPPDVDDAADKISRGQEYGRRRHAGELREQAAFRTRLIAAGRARASASVGPTAERSASTIDLPTRTGT
jgi:hypothetical protein